MEIAEKLPPEAAAEVPEKEHVVVVPHDDIKAAANYMKKAEKDFHIIDKPLNYDGFKVSAITGEYGDYKIQDGLYFYFRSSAGMSLLRVGLANVKEVLDEIRRAAKVLGVDV